MSRLVRLDVEALVTPAELAWPGSAHRIQSPPIARSRGMQAHSGRDLAPELFQIRLERLEAAAVASGERCSRMRRWGPATTPSSTAIRKAHSTNPTAIRPSLCPPIPSYMFIHHPNHLPRHPPRHLIACRPDPIRMHNRALPLPPLSARLQTLSPPLECTGRGGWKLVHSLELAARSAAAGRAEANLVADNVDPGEGAVGGDGGINLEAAGEDGVGESGVGGGGPFADLRVGGKRLRVSSQASHDRVGRVDRRLTP